jgi:hypothetical protein
MVGISIAGGVGYYAIQLTETKAGVVGEGADGITVRRGNTYQALGRSLGAVTITPPGWIARLVNAIKTLVGKPVTPLFDQVEQHDKGATSSDYVRIAHSALATNAIVGAAEANRLPSSVGRDLNVGLPRPSNPAGPELPAPAYFSPDRPQTFLPSPQNVGGWPGSMVRDIFSQLQRRVPPEWRVERPDDIVEGDVSN